MRYKYYFCERYNAKLIEFLKERNVRYSPDNGNLEGELISFSIWSNSLDINYLLNELERMKVGCPIVSVEFSNTELKKAKLLVMSPKKQCIDIINSEESYRYSCRWITSVGVEKVNHKEQIGTVAIRKEPPTKTSTAFWTEDTGFSEVFTDRRVYELVIDNSLLGIEFEKVMNKKGIYSENIFQMKSTNIITRDCIVMGHGERREVCHACGKEQFNIDNTYQLHLDFTKFEFQSDLYMTEKIFGEGIAYPLYVISQRFYQLLIQNKLSGGITFSPVVESDS